MRLATFLVGDEEKWGFVLPDPFDGRDWVLEPERVQKALAVQTSVRTSGYAASRPSFYAGEWPTTLAGFLSTGESGMSALFSMERFVTRYLEQSDQTLLDRAGHSVDEVEILAPIPRPRLCWGLVANSPSFVRNNLGITALTLFPLAHQRPQGSVIGPDQPVVMKNGHQLPFYCYNAELAIVIGKQGRYIPIDRAMEHVAGYTTVTDLGGSYYYGIVPGNESHTLTLPEGYSDWFYQATASWGGKMADTLCPMGPYIVTKDEIGDPYDLLVYTKQNGRVRDRSHTAATLIGIERAIHWYSSFATLYPGDVIHFGTMGFDGLRVTPPASPAEAPEVLESEIERVGALRNPVRIREIEASADDHTDHPSYAVRELARRERSEVAKPQPWDLAETRHFYTLYGNYERAEELEGLAVLEHPRFLNGPNSSLGLTGSGVEIPLRATDLLVRVELAFVVSKIACEVPRERAFDYILGFTPLVSLCDQSFADAVPSTARLPERSITAVYGRWADGFNVISAKPVSVDRESWHGLEMTLQVGDAKVVSTTGEYVAGPAEIIETISKMITLFPGDVITLGGTSESIRIPAGQLTDGRAIRGEVHGIGEVEFVAARAEGVGSAGR